MRCIQRVFLNIISNTSLRGTSVPLGRNIGYHMDQQKARQLSELLEKYHQGTLSGKEKALLDDWVGDLGKNQDYSALTELDKLEMKNNLREFINKKSGEKVITISPLQARQPMASVDLGRPRAAMVAWRIAASILLVAALTYSISQFTHLRDSLFPYREIISTSVSGSINKVVLADGSIVWLKNNSTLSRPKKFSGDDRQVTFEGEALFEVAKDPEHPFIIQCGDLITTVMGTSFNIKASEENIEVMVLTGKVALTSATDKQGIVVLQDEKAVYNRLKKQLAKVEAAKEESVAIVSGTGYDMNFNDTRMSEIIRRIEGKFNVEVSVGNPNLGNCVITADFTDQSLKRTLDIICTALAIEYEVDDNEVKLSGNGCN